MTFSYGYKEAIMHSRCKLLKNANIHIYYGVILLILLNFISITPSVLAAGLDIPSSSPLLPDPVSSDIVSRKSLSSDGGEGNHGMSTYIITAIQPPVATYRGGIDGYEPTASENKNKLDMNDSATQAYRDYLKSRQTELIGQIEKTLGRSVTVVQTLQTAINAIFVQLSPSEAKMLAKLKGIDSIQKDQARKLEHVVGDNPFMVAPIPGKGSGREGGFRQDEPNYFQGVGVFSPFTKLSAKSAARSIWQGGFAWIQAPKVWQTRAHRPGIMGENVIVGVIDTGINPLSPSFAAKGDDGYTIKNPKGTYVGVCNPDESVYDPSFPCNDKLIGAWGYPLIDNGSPIDTLGHGSHDAGTAVGNIVNHATYKTVRGNRITKKIAGVAPHANLIAYRVCSSELCSESAILFAIDRAIQDGVDVVNYSIGDDNLQAVPTDPWAGSVSKALLAAENAGIFVSTSAGNSGPKANTINSTSAAPWVTSVAYSTHNLMYASILTDMTGGKTPPPYIAGQSFSRGSSKAQIVDAADFSQPDCQKDGYRAKFKGAIVICRIRRDLSNLSRGVMKSMFANGAGALVMILDEYTPSGRKYGPGDLRPFDTNKDEPFIIITHQDGERLLQWMSRGGKHKARLTATRLVEDASQSDDVVIASSRGAQRTNPTLLKPDITAPGQTIFSAYNAKQEYEIDRGSSMAAAEMSGAAALVKAAHRQWTPMQIQSALMTTAQTHLHKADGQRAATPFDMGAGRVDVSRAVRAGLVLDESVQNFIAADPHLGGEPATLNLSSLGQSDCVVNCTWTRVVTNSRSIPTGWLAITDPAVTVQPAAFSLNPGEQQRLTFTVDVSGTPVDQWKFDQVSFKSLTPGVPDAHFPLAAMSAASNLNHVGETKIITAQPSGHFTLSGLKTIEMNDAQVQVLGAAKARITHGKLPSTSGVGSISSDNRYTSVILKVPQGAQRIVAEITQTDSKDLDLFLGTGEAVDSGKIIYKAAHPMRAKESLNVAIPAGATSIWISVQNYRDIDADRGVSFTLNTAFLSAPTNNLSVSVPASVAAGQPFSADLSYNLSGSRPGDEFYGLFTLGSDSEHPDNLGSRLIHIVRK
jgi:hypothetical protein